jgi:hypothetical protein
VWGNEKAHKFLVLKTERRDHLEGLAIDSGNNEMDLAACDGRLWNVLILGSAKWRAVVSMALNLQLL